MSAEDEKHISLEIGHVLFIDIVGYSELLIKEQREIQHRLVEVVRRTEEFRNAEAEGKLTRLPTGDGMALVFFSSPEAPVKCALQIAELVRGDPSLKLRMGVHSGPVSQTIDVNDRINLAGAGVNIAQRIMNCGDAGHILLSKHVAEDLEQYGNWNAYLHDLGECEVKHGARVRVVNLYTEELGNAALPRKFKRVRNWSIIRAFAALVLRAAGEERVRAAQSGSENERRAGRAFLPVPEKSIAVLPFENRSDEKQNKYFADGVQDEILTNLAKVPEFKVVSRRSVMQYESAVSRNVREIGQQLSVAHVVEGAVQRSGDRIRVNAQLIDARTDAHLWAKTYDRDLADVFAIQSEIATAIAQELQANLSPKLKASIEKPPTTDLVAFDLYTRAKTLLLSYGFGGHKKAADVLKGTAELLAGAIARDRAFLGAYCLLSQVNGEIYMYSIDHTPARLAITEEAIRNAQRFGPDAGETHLALAQYYYRCRLDYGRAREEVNIAARLLPNESTVYFIAGLIDRRQSRWDDSVRYMEKGLQLDPRHPWLLRQLAISYQFLHRYSDVATLLDRCLAVAPDEAGTRLARASVELDWHANPKPLHDTIREVITADPDPATAVDVADWWFKVALCERDPAEISAAVNVISSVGIGDENLIFPREFCEGFAVYMKGDVSAARDFYNRAREAQERIVREQPDYGQAVCVLGVIDAALGRKDEAIAEGRRALELLPVSKECINGVIIMKNVAVIYAWCGERDLAIEQIRATLQHPNELSYGILKLHPYWDPLRGDPRFEEIVGALAPKDVK